MKPSEKLAADPDYREVRTGKRGTRRFRYVGPSDALPHERAFTGGAFTVERRRLEQKQPRNVKGEAKTDLERAKRRRDRRRRREAARART